MEGWTISVSFEGVSQLLPYTLIVDIRITCLTCFTIHEFSRLNDPLRLVFT